MSSANIHARRICTRFADYVSQQQAALFVGAGLSVAAGYPDWGGILTSTSEQLGIDTGRILDYPALAQYYVNEASGNKSLIENAIVQQLRPTPQLRPVHEELAKLPINTIWTTNYDRVLEEIYSRFNPDVKVGDQSLLSGVVASRVTIYKMHGTATPQPRDLVITQDDYENYFLRYPLMCRQLASDFATKSFLFLGVSFKDPNVRNIVAQLRGFLRGNTRTHFIIYKTPEPEIKREHELWLKDLSRYGIVGIEVSDWDEVSKYLSIIRKRSFPRSVLVSGSHDGREYEEFCSSLGRAIARSGLVLLSGEGRNVTTYVSEGAFNYLIDRNQDYVPMIQLFRVPQFARRSNNNRYRLSYRRQLVSRARLMIVIAGQEGTSEEVDLGIESDIPILPIAWTGGTAQRIWELMGSRRTLPPWNMISDEDFKLLAERPSPGDEERYADRIIKMVSHILAIDGQN